MKKPSDEKLTRWGSWNLAVEQAIQELGCPVNRHILYPVDDPGYLHPKSEAFISSWRRRVTPKAREILEAWARAQPCRSLQERYFGW